MPGGVAVVVGGEVEPSEAGHSGAGGFANDVVLVFPVGGGAEAQTAVKSGDDVACARGWASMCPAPAALVSSSCTAAFVLFGGLSGNDENPVRLGDTYLLTVCMSDDPNGLPLSVGAVVGQEGV